MVAQGRPHQPHIPASGPNQAFSLLDLAFPRSSRSLTICTALLLRRKSTCSTPRYHWLHLPPTPSPQLQACNDQLKAPPQTLHAQPGTPAHLSWKMLSDSFKPDQTLLPFHKSSWAALLSLTLNPDLPQSTQGQRYFLGVTRKVLSLHTHGTKSWGQARRRTRGSHRALK